MQQIERSLGLEQKQEEKKEEKEGKEEEKGWLDRFRKWQPKPLNPFDERFEYIDHFRDIPDRVLSLLLFNPPPISPLLKSDWSLFFLRVFCLAPCQKLHFHS